MENLSLNNRRRRQSIAFASKPDSHDRFFSRLPTPEESTSSHRSSDDERRSKVTRRHSPDHSRSREFDHPERLPGDMLFPRPGGQSHVPDSPPYQSSDAQRPSLPPLKTILASSLTSPPRSPAFHCSSVQPSPQEPTYTSATYKPPSLYPQKKQRTEYLLEPVPPISASASASPLFKSDAVDYRARRAPPNDVATSPRMRFGDSSRLSLPPQPAYPTPASPRSSQRPTQPFFADSMGSNARPIENFPHPRGHNVNMSPPTYGPSPAHREAAHALSPRNPYDRRFERRDSTRASYEPDYVDSGHQNDRAIPPGTEPRRLQARRPASDEYDASQYVRRADFPADQRPAEAQQEPYQPGQPSFFMPSQYDYRHGRARKRSNLPKQSTEIMKTWFDQNISNPYPSEEQKAIFSNATGISMTQVSNWFINHRRRCPELRDKRERTRGRECEV